VEEEVDKCIECGFCEHKCPSRDITLTPRRRIVVRRALEQMKLRGEMKQFNQLVHEYQYDGLDTCAVDGLCATECPVDINTGDLVKRLRRESHSSFANNFATTVAKNFGIVESTVKFLIGTGVLVNSVFGRKAMTNITGGMKKIIPSFPRWMPAQAGPVKINGNKSIKPSFIYFATCITRSMGKSVDGGKSVIDSLLSVAAKSGIQVHVPVNIHGHCCGQPFSSKGFAAAASLTKNKTIEWLWEQTLNGELPVILDMSSCTHTLLDCRPYLDEENKKKYDKLSIIDSVDFIHDYAIEKLIIKNRKGSIALHPVCSLIKMKNAHKFIAVAKACSESANVPLYAGCCGMAGDRGMLFPELTRSATAPENAELSLKKYDGYYSSSKTCEMALSGDGSFIYESIVRLVDEVS